MLGGIITRAGRVRDEAEKPFWISYADLMTALMVLFLVVMTVALVSVTEEVDEAKELEKQQAAAVNELLDELQNEIMPFKDQGVTLNRSRRAIEFGSLAIFDHNQAILPEDKQTDLRRFIPSVLDVASTEKGRRWIRRIVVEGYTSQSGDYLYNLNLSLRRSQSFLCALFAPPSEHEIPLSLEQQRQIRALFIVGGYSANLAKKTDRDSRRVELRVEFYGPNLEEFEDRKGQNEQQWATDNFGKCQSRWLQ